MIKIYFSNYSKQLSNSNFSRYLHVLAPELKQKILSYRRWEDQHAALYGKLLLMEALKEAGFQSNLLNLQYTNYGRPYIEGTPDFNISHSGFLAVCALSFQYRIGIDIEHINPVAIASFENEFSKEEWNIVAASANPNYWFYYYWTAKEAAIKADGGGMSFPLNKINIKDNTIKVNKTMWFIKNIPICKYYVLHIATDKKIETEVEIVEIYF